MGLSAGAQKVKATSQHDFDFGNHKRYAWHANHVLTRQGHQNDAIIEQSIVQSVNRTLAAKGFSEDSANPDFFVSCDAGAPVSIADVETPAPPPGVDGRTDPYPGVRQSASASPYPGLRQNVWYSVDGVITFHLTDAKSNRVVWTAEATKKIRDPKKAMKDLDQQVEQFVSKAFKSFPPRPK
jgi:hypothetical protein